MSALAGKRIVVTRAAHQAEALNRLLRDKGAIPVSYPCIAIQPPADTSALDAALRDIGALDALLLTSANAVAAVADRLRTLDLQPDWSRLTVAALGAATEAALLERLGIQADFVPAEQTAQGLARELPLEIGSRALLPQSAIASESTAEILRGRGAQARAVIAYETVIGGGGDDLPGMLAREEIDALSFASPSAVDFFARRCPRSAAESARALPVACLGPQTANRARESGYASVIAPPVSGLRAMVEALAAAFAAANG